MIRVVNQELCKPSEEEFHKTEIAVNVMQNFKGLDCSICNQLFGFQCRTRPESLFCSQHCLTFGQHNMEKQFKNFDPTLCEAHHGHSPGVLDSSKFVSASQQYNDMLHFHQGTGVNSQGGHSQLPFFKILNLDHDHIDGDKEIVDKQEDESFEKKSEKLSTEFFLSDVVQDYRNTILQSQRGPIVNEPVNLVEAGQDSSPANLLPVVEAKKYWTMDDMTLSKSLLNCDPCIIAFTWTITKYHLNATGDEQKLTELQDSIAKYCQNAPALGRVPSVNEIVFAPYDGEYYRARVSKVDGASGSAEVIFIDYGDESQVKLTECREAQDEIMKTHPIYGLIFHLILDNELPESVKNGPIPEELVNATAEEVNPIIAHSPTESEWRGKLLMRKSVLIRTFNDVLQELIVNKMTTTLVSRAPVPVVVGAKRQTPKWTIHNVKWSDNLKSSAKVYPTYIWDMSKLTVSAEADEENMNNLQMAINHFVTNAPPMTQTPEVDKIVIAPYDKFYYRGRVSKILDDDKVEVMFIDYGDKAEVKVSDLKEPTEEIMKHPIYGVSVRISGVPLDVPFKENKELMEKIEAGGHLIVESRTDPTLWTGQLLTDDGKPLSDLINKIIQSNGN